MVQKTVKAKIDIQYDGSKSSIGYSCNMRSGKYTFWEHGKRILTITKAEWDRLMDGGALPSEIPALLKPKKEEQKVGSITNFFHHHMHGHDDYTDSGERRFFEDDHHS